MGCRRGMFGGLGQRRLNGMMTGLGLLLLTCSAAPASAASLSWSGALSLDSPNAFSSVVCLSSNECVAVDDAG